MKNNKILVYLKRVSRKFDKYIKDKKEENIKSQKLEDNVLKNTKRYKLLRKA